MSFSSGVKKEIYSVSKGDRHCRLAMLSALICGSAHYEKGDLHVKTENGFVAKLFFDIVKRDFGIRCNVLIKKAHSKVYHLDVGGEEVVEKILRATGLFDELRGFVKKTSTLIVKSECCRRAYFMGIFISSGYICNPKKTYHCEFVFSEGCLADSFMRLLRELGLSGKQIVRKGHIVIYFKDGEQISDILNITGAHNSLMKYENIRILKDVGNSINRSVNCEAANFDKSIEAAIRQIESINVIKNEVGLSYLPKNLEEIARIRLEYPESTLREIGEKLTPAVGKSGVNHRLRKIRQIAEGLEDVKKNKECKKGEVR